MLLRGHAGDYVGPSMVGTIRDDESRAACYHLAHLHREIVGFAARTRKDDVAKLLREGRKKFLGEHDRLNRQVAGMGVENTRLFADRLHNDGMTMAYDRHVIVGIKVAPTLLVIQPHSLGTYDLQRLLVEE